MQINNEKLIELIEQAACSTNLLNPQDVTEIDKLQSVLQEIGKSVEETTDISADTLAKVKGSTSDAVNVLTGILQNQIGDTDKAIKSITESVSILQNLITQIEQGNNDKAKNETPEQQFTTADEDAVLMMDFAAESGEHIESAEAGLLELESRPDNKEVLNQIFRAFHTVKGMAGFLNLTDIGSLAHSAENLLDLARKGELLLTGKNTDAVFESIDMLKKMVSDLKGAIETKQFPAKQSGLPQLLEKLKLLAQKQSLPEVLNTPEGTKRDEKLEDVLSGKEEVKPEASEIKQEITPETDRRDGIPRRSGEDRRSEANADDKIKVSTSRLDNLINMTGELVIAQLMIAEEATNRLSSEYDLNRKVAQQGKIIRELQELSMSMRMVPIEGVFQKMARLVRDLSRKADKKINFVTKGEETELDRNIVDKIADPLVHMVRNSVDHGIESKEERCKSGKDAAGRIELRAFHQAGNIVIEIEDDGKGLNKERILKKAIENRIVDPNQQLSDEEIYKLIFHAGLSTAEKITSISGRGVGMDVVKKNIESLHGKIEISSNPGKGTIFTIRLPLTLAIIDGQIIRIGDERFIVPINAIVQTLKPRQEQLSSVQNNGEMVMVRGKLLPLVRLYRLFKVVPTTKDPTQSLIMIVEEEGEKCCLLVDELLGQQQVVIKSLGDGLGKVQGVSGGAIMGDGKISLILDIPGIMKLSQGKVLQEV
ncbi:MAG: Chemotaxis protein CheA [Planctomycetes bacterium ADurb.Bin401]|nr:MAG: Chemotaxis protein CheA [Planctomycetes bacterium ADurb.Bin401]